MAVARPGTQKGMSSKSFSIGATDDKSTVPHHLRHARWVAPIDGCSTISLRAAKGSPQHAHQPGPRACDGFMLSRPYGDALDQPVVRQGGYEQRGPPPQPRSGDILRT